MSETMGQIIRRLRKERNLTQEELAEQLNVTFQAVSRWENGTGMPDISQIVPLARVFCVSTDVLFGTVGVNDKEEVWKIINNAQSLLTRPLDSTGLLKNMRHCRKGLKYIRIIRSFFWNALKRVSRLPIRKMMCIRRIVQRQSIRNVSEWQIW